MDDIAHGLPLNHRKRKAASADDPQDPSPAKPVVNTTRLLTDGVQGAASGPDNAPRQPWLASDSGDALWSSPTSPQVSSPLSSHVVHSAYPENPSKRPRLDRVPPSPIRTSARRPPRRFPAKIIPSKSPTVRHGSDIEDIGIVSTADPGPSSGSLLRARVAIPSSSKPAERPPRLAPIDLNSPHIPSLLPLINRQTLKELDLDAILRNPQLRHDLLFDPGLQFRPTCSPRKRDLAEKYWLAITHEIETGCTCVTLDSHGKSRPTFCVCTQFPTPAPLTIVVSHSPSPLSTLRMPSRIRGLLTEFLEVLLLVIQPLSTISGIYVNAAKFKAQMDQHSAQAAFMRSVFDPVLIEQELKHGLFDPSGLFRTIGATLKGHCAPMRDRAVENMVQAAQACAPGGTGTKADAVKAVRMCMEILELMKLDIANHQLQTLRPFLIRTSGQFELKTLKSRNGDSLHLTREWLHTAHSSVTIRTHPIHHPLYPPNHLQFGTLTHNQRIYFAVIKGIVDLVFNPPPAIISLSSPGSAPPSPISPLTASPISSFPETFHLDNSRLLAFNIDAADATAACMFLLLYRQLVFSDLGESSPHDPPKVDDAELIKLKREIRDIASMKLGVCFSVNAESSIDHKGAKIDTKEVEKWQDARQDVVLQISRRAKEVQRRASSGSSSSSSPPLSPIGEIPDERMLSLAQRWAETHMVHGSSLSQMMHDRLRDTVFNAVVALAYPGPNGKFPNINSLPIGKSDGSLLGMATGMEPLAEEIRSLSEKISRLAIVHINAYLPIYEKEGFLQL